MASLTALMCLISYQLVSGRIIDMAYTLGPQSLAYGGNPPFNMTSLFQGELSPGVWAEMNWFSTNEHRGTHMDAPVHFWKTSWTVDQIPADKLMGPGIILRAIEEAQNNSNFQISKEWIDVWESENGKIPEKAIVFMDFGWGEHHKAMNKTLIFGTEDTLNSSTYHFPGMAGDGMEFLVSERKINIIGTDTPSLDYGQSSTYPSHVMAMKNNIPALENVANLDQVPAKGAHIIVAPMKLKGGSGGPARIFAVVDETFKSPQTCSASHDTVSLVLLLSLLFFI